jgi:two-component system, cell cycle response regulator
LARSSPLNVARTIAKQVLVVDDDHLVREYLARLLTAAGHEVLTAETGEAALESMQRAFTPIVIVDVNLPGLDGLEVCRAIRQLTYSGYVYIMLHSSKDTEEDILAGLDAGADDYLSKRAPKSQLVGRLLTAQRILSLEQSLKMALADRENTAMTDVLTGAYNRRYLLQHLGHELDGARRACNALSVLVLDFDHFSQVNDRFGHAAGDSALREVAHRIQRNLRRSCDWYARLGGDAFAVVLPQTDIVGASVAAEKFRSAIGEPPMKVGNRAIHMTVSIGASALETADHETMTAQMLLDRAEQGLYKSKRAGRNQVTAFGRCST